MCRLIAIMLSILVGASAASAQTTGFTYQGRLTDGGTPTTAVYDLQFGLWDSQTGGNQIGTTQSLNSVQVTNGVFTVTLDFGATAFPGASRFLAISAKVAGAGSFTLLTPRQPITSTPYAVRSLNASTVDSVPVSAVPAGSGNYIQNTSAQQTANLNINGNATVGGTMAGNVVNATTQFNLNGVRILSSNQGGTNLFAGVGAGQTNTGGSNSFFGHNAGNVNANAGGNSFFGALSGLRNTTGSGNSFFGHQSGIDTTSGIQNSFFGLAAGRDNTLGDENACFGVGAGLSVTTGSSNTFIGSRSGFSAETNKTGNYNTLLGNGTDVGPGVNQSTAIGAFAQVTQSNSLVLGSSSTSVGIGTTAPKQRLHVAGQGVFTTSSVGFDPGDGAGPAIRIGYNSTGDYGYINANVTGVIFKHLILQGSVADGNVGIGTTNPDQKLTVNGGASKPGGGSWANFSDERLKNIKGRFTLGLEAVLKLQPLRYEYKRDNALNLNSQGQHVGFSAQAVEKIIPEAVTKNSNGYLLVNNDPILWTMLNAIKEQQSQLEQLRKEVNQLRNMLRRQRQQPARQR